MVIHWSYLHFLGCTHLDLFALAQRQEFAKSVDSGEFLINTDVFRQMVHSLPATPERKSKILANFSANPYDAYAKRFENSDVRILSARDVEFPAELLVAPNPLFLLYVRGDLAPSKLRIGFVGSREATPYGEQIVKSFVPALARAGISIVSGGALGIDSLSHEAAIQANGHTIVVLGSGVDRPYPRAHEHLFDRIVQVGGAVVSHFPMGTDAAPYTFPQRNEIIAALSRGLVVVEAKERSGSLITAQLALEMGKDVFAIPSDIGRRNSLGTNRLIQSASAKLLLSPEDLLEEYGIRPESALSALRRSHTKSSDSLEYRILSVIDGNPMNADSLAESLRVGISEIQVELGKMEIFGTIARDISGNYFANHG